jgi:hypothetical protein
VPTRQIPVERLSVVSKKSFEEILEIIDSAVGHPDIREMQKAIAAAQTYPAMESIVQKLVGPNDLMEFMRLDLGQVISKGKEGEPAKCLRLLIGNPLIMRKMAELVPDAGSYAPVTILIDQRPDGIHLSYDKMTSLLAPYENADALKIAKDLDLKIEILIRSTC